MTGINTAYPFKHLTRKPYRLDFVTLNGITVDVTLKAEDLSNSLFEIYNNTPLHTGSLYSMNDSMTKTLFKIKHKPECINYIGVYTLNIHDYVVYVGMTKDSFDARIFGRGSGYGHDYEKEFNGFKCLIVDELGAIPTIEFFFINLFSPYHNGKDDSGLFNHLIPPEYINQSKAGKKWLEDFDEKRDRIIAAELSKIRPLTDFINDQ